MSVDRKRLLEGRSKALNALAHPDLPQPIRELYKKAADHADAALSLQEAGKKPSTGPSRAACR